MLGGCKSYFATRLNVVVNLFAKGIDMYVCTYKNAISVCMLVIYVNLLDARK